MRLGMNRRVRIRVFPAYTTPFWRKLNRWLTFLLVVTLFVLCSNTVLARFRPVIEAAAQQRAHFYANMAINQAVAKRMAEENITYSDLVTIQKGPDGNVTSLSANVVEMNKLKAALAIDIQQGFGAIDAKDAGIPLGAALGNDFLVGWGPKIPLRLFQAGYTDIDFKSSFTSAGINQTKHEIYIEAKTKVGAIFPSGRKDTDIVSTVPIAQTVIVGTVPNSFTAIDGASGNAADKALNLLD